MQRVYHLHDLVGEAVELPGGEPPDGGDPGQHVEQALLRHVRRSDVQFLPKWYIMKRSILSEEGMYVFEGSGDGQRALQGVSSGCLT